MRTARLDGRALHQIRIPGNALVMGIGRKGEVVVPHGNTTFLLGDVVMLVGGLDDIREATVVLQACY